MVVLYYILVVLYHVFNKYAAFRAGTPFVSSENLKRIRAGSMRSSSLQSQGKVIAWLIDNDSNEQCEKGKITPLATL